MALPTRIQKPPPRAHTTLMTKMCKPTGEKRESELPGSMLPLLTSWTTLKRNRRRRKKRKFRLRRTSMIDTWTMN